MNTRSTLLTGAVLGFLGVALGAFGAHALKPLLLANGRLDTYELAVRYHFYHAGALLIVGLLQARQSVTVLRIASLCFVLGVLLFSGSLYIMSIAGTTAVAMITPIGGVFLLAGWLLTATGIWKTVEA